MKFTKAQRTDTFIKLALTGPSGSGKTYSALRLARGLVGPNGKIAVVDTENGSAKLYSDLTEFFHCDLCTPHFTDFTSAITEAEKAGFDCVIIDSFSAVWQGILEYKSNLDRKGGNSFSNWNDAGKHFNEVIQTVLQAKIHVIACMRSKQEYVVQEETNSKGKTVQVPKKIGLAPVMRDNIEYEFTTVFEIGMDHQCTPSKDRTGLFTDKTFRIDETTGQQIKKWLSCSQPVNPESANQEPASGETDEFLSLISKAESKESLGNIGQKIKDSNLSDTQKAVVRSAYKERLTSLA